jgi:3-hydroxyacyl-CoA dehydrogenase / enoyl-CoA hydratase / 3-hydroxybutyryl-CoA epimerase
MNSTETRSNFHISLKKNTGIAVVLLDCGGKLNSLGTPVMNDLQRALQIITNDDNVKGVVLISGKPDNFAIGADLFELRAIKKREEFLHLSSTGQHTLNALADLPKPVVVAINGPCLGGGLELALAGHWRIATDQKVTRLGLPETRLGLIPGLGGTQRLPRLVGLKQALAMIMGAETISAQEALDVGLVDEVVPAAELLERAENKAFELVNDQTPIVERRRFVGTGSAAEWPVKDVDVEKANKLFAMTDRSVRIRTKGNYPAQTRVTAVIKTGLTQGILAGLEEEAQTFADLAGSDTAANLIALFFQTDFAKQSAAGLATKFGESNTTTIGIVGGGMMGASIASMSAAHGLNVVLKVNSGRTAETAERVDGENIEIVEDFAQLAKCQLVIECIIEDVAQKQQLLNKIEAVVSSDCIIASNTSALSLSELASSMKKNDRFVGLHFFHPVDRMPLVEIISLKSTGRKAAARAADYVTRLEKIPLLIKDGPGFLINRLLSCYLLEAARLVEEGTPLNWIEEAALEFGLPMGPFEVLDEVGLDLGFKVADTLHKNLGDRMRTLAILENIPRLGLVGKKNGRGVFIYDESGRKKELNPDVGAIKGLTTSPEKADEATKERIVKRLIYPMIDEAARCLEDRIVMKPREVDMAIVYGIGFPPFRGGLLKYADHVGLSHIAADLESWHKSGATPRDVSSLIKKYIAEGRGFYSRTGKEEE